MTARRLRRDRAAGFVLVNVLVIVAALSAVALHLLRDATEGAGRTGVVRAASQAELYAEAGVLLAADLLRRDLRSGGADHRGEAWALDGYVTGLRDAEVTVTVRDLESGFNLNLLSGPEAQPARAVLDGLARATGASPALTAALLARAATPSPAAVDPGARQDFRGGDLTHVADLDALPGADDPAARPLLDRLAALPQARGINVNTAPPDLLGALTRLAPDAVAALVARRDATPFEDAAAFTQAVEALDDTAALPVALVGVATQWFEVEASAQLDGLTHRMRAILRRDPDAGTVTVFARQAETTA